MFRANVEHNQLSMLDSTQWMDSKVREKLRKSWAPIFYEHVFCQIDEEPFSVLYGTTGNPNFPVNILLSLEYIKFMKDYSDLDLLDAFSFDYQVNYAVGIHTLGERNLAERTLYYFRERIYDYCLSNPDGEDLLFRQFLILLHGFADKAGIMMEKQRADTTMFMSNIKKAGRMSLAHDVLVVAVKAIPEDLRTEALSNVLKPGFKTDLLFRTKSQDRDSKLTTMLNLCADALRILKALPGEEATEAGKLAERFLNEQSILDQESGKLSPKPRKEIATGTLQSAYDHDATFRRKGDVSQSGYVLEISETCDRENQFQLITDYKVEPNNVSDQKIMEGRLKPIRRNTGCTDMYLDGGFHSDDVHKIAAENDIKIHLTNMSGEQQTKKLPVSKFTIDMETNVIQQCPGGHAPTQAGVSGGQTVAHFSHEACANCEHASRCHIKKQNKDCVVRINLKAVEVSRKREVMKAGKLENTSMRAGIEGSNSALKRCGLDKLDVRGITKSDIVCGFMTTVQNIKRFIKYKRGGYKKKRKPVGVPAPCYT
ncbi:MAG: transposase [Coriobacteriia bacterium]|nr:transposase [Coriobacteriia bacterium]